MRRVLTIWLVVLMAALTGCDNTTMRSSVPTYPVHLELNIVGLFSHFRPTGSFAVYTFVPGAFPKERPELPLDKTGYGGLLVWTAMDEDYHACDMCCPHCLDRKSPVQIDGMFAVCPICNEAYDLSFGYAFPTRNKSKEALRMYQTSYNGDKLLVYDQ